MVKFVNIEEYIDFADNEISYETIKEHFIEKEER